MMANATSDTDERDRATDRDDSDHTTDQPDHTTDRPDATADGQADVASDVADSVRLQSERVADREVQQALRKLEARGDLTAGQQRAVQEMADGIVESLVAAPARTVEAAREADDETLRTVVDLFDPDG
jgi:glutamyl-tRNA reductase